MKKNCRFLVILIIFLYTSILFSTGSLTISTFTASADFVNISSVVYCHIELKDIKTNEKRYSFSFSPSPLCLGIGTTWYTANEYGIIYTTFTAPVCGRLIVYTDNKADDANPKYTGTENPAGLICITDTTATPLNLCWRVTDISTTNYNIGWYLDGSNMKLYATGLPQTYWCFLWMKDKSDGQWKDPDIAYATIRSFDLSGTWLHHAEGDCGKSVSPDYFYLGANFENAKRGKTYKTSTLRFEFRFD